MTEKLYDVESKYTGRLSITESATGSYYVWAGAGIILRLTEQEIKNIINTPGGRNIIENYLIVNDKDLLDKMKIDVQPEYFYTKEDVKKLLEEGTEDQLKDAIDFAPEGTKELIADVAVEERIPNLNKIETISKGTGRDIASQIKTSDVSSTEEKVTVKTRRTEPFVNKVTPVYNKK